MAADRRRRDVRGVPGVVRHAVQRLLPGAAADPGRADRARRRLRVPAARSTTRAGAVRWDCARSSVGPCRRCCGAWRSRTSCAASPIDADARVHRHASGTCSTPTRCWAGWRRCCSSSPTARVFFALKTDGHVRDARRRVRRRGPRPPLVGGRVRPCWTQVAVPAALVMAVAGRRRRASRWSRVAAAAGAVARAGRFLGTGVAIAAGRGRAVRGPVPRRDAVDAGPTANVADHDERRGDARTRCRS